MEHYPLDYVTQLAPVIFIQGLGETKAIEDVNLSLNPVDVIQRQIPEVQVPNSGLIKLLFQQYDITNKIWVSEFVKSKFNSSSLVFKVRCIGQQFQLPTSESGSKLSPFNLESQIYPQGVLDPRWITKHKNTIPSVFLSFHELEGYAGLSETEIASKDNKLALEISSLKEKIQARGIRFIEILVTSEASGTALVDRVNNLRSLTQLAPRTGLLFLPSGTEKEYGIFVEAILHLMMPWCYDYYINLEKKCRKKRATPPGKKFNKNIAIENGKIVGYSLDQWDARYAVKLALINGFHQNNEMSIKHLESAYEALTMVLKDITLATCHEDPEAVFLWHQVRQLLDVLTISVCRLYLYLDLTNKAYRRFDSHIQNTISILKENNINPSSYFVSDWLGIQFQWLGELCVSADAAIVPIDRPLLADYKFGDLAMPQPGYVFLQSINFLRRSQAKVESFAVEREIEFFPELASLVKTFDEICKKVLQKDSKTAEILDLYLSLDLQAKMKYPYHHQAIKLLELAFASFEKSSETKFESAKAYINFQLAEDYYSIQQYEKAITYYEDCGTYYKEGNWKNILVLVLTKLMSSFIKLLKTTSAILCSLELAVIDKVFFPANIGVSGLLQTIQNKEIPLITLLPAENENSAPNIFTGSFLFKDSVLPLAQSSHMQLALKNLCNDVFFLEITIDSIVIDFEGYFSPVKITHDGDCDLNYLKKLSLTEDEGFRLSTANLKFSSKQVKVLQFSQMANQINKNKVKSISLNISQANYQIKFQLPISTILTNDSFLDSKNNSAVVTPENVDINTNYYLNKINTKKFFWLIDDNKKQVVVTNNPYEIIVIPRRPKAEIIVKNPTTAFTNEAYQLKLSIINNDHEKIGVIFRPLVKIYDNINSNTRASSQLSSRVSSPRNSLDLQNTNLSTAGGGLTLSGLQWNKYSDIENPAQVASPDLKLTQIESNSTTEHSLFIKIPDVIKKYVIIKIECSFFTGENIESQQESEEKTKSLSTRDTINIRLPVVPPLLFLFGVIPQLKPKDIPCPFIFDSSNPLNNKSITTHERSWRGKASMKYQGSKAIVITKSKLEISTSKPNEFACEVVTETTDEFPKTIDSKSACTVTEMFTTKRLEKAGHTSIPINGKMKVQWRRADSKIVNSLESSLWSLTLPLLEPRVLLEYSSSDSVLKYTLENPTPRIFTFSVSIDSNENFDITEGIKEIAKLPVLPFTRQQLNYRIVARQNGPRLKIPSLKVFDLYYKVSLPVLVATEEALADASGGIFLTIE